LAARALISSAAALFVFQAVSRSLLSVSKRPARLLQGP
jgi:hypothetical protein